MRLEELVLENFRGFEELKLRFHPEVTIIAGINGSGKTSVLDAVSQMLTQIVIKGRAALGKMDSRSGQQNGKALLKVSFNGGRFSAVEVFSGGSWSSDGRVQNIPFSEAQLSSGPVPIWPYYKVNRYATDSTPGSTDPGVWRARNAWDGSQGHRSFEHLFHWFREREDVENEERRDHPSHVDHQLQAVRDALVTLLPGYENPRVRRPRYGSDGGESVAVIKPVLAITKEGNELAFDQLSEGERTTTALVCDIARRLAIANPSDPLQGEGVVLIDEIDLHLHPKWQAQIIPALRKTFPHLQLLVTTHSPIVLSYVQSESVRLIKNFHLMAHVPHTRGRDPNAMLTDVFDQPLRPKDVDLKLHHVAKLIDDDLIEEAKRSLAPLRAELGPDDRDVIRLNAMIDLLEA